MGVGAAVRSVAGGAAFHLNRRMLIEVRATLLVVAVDAALKVWLVQTGPIQRTVRIMAVSTLHQSLRHAMVDRQSELRLHRAVAAEAQRRLRLLQQTAMQPANFVRQLWDLIKMPLRGIEVILALVFHFLDQMRGVALVA